MILYFSGTGNSLAIARKIAEAIDDQVLPLTEAVQQDLTNEKRIGLVFPTYVPSASRVCMYAHNKPFARTAKRHARNANIAILTSNSKT